MTPDVVAIYLKQHPEFFEQYADMLAEIFIPHPHGGRTTSISERQILTLREKNKQLEIGYSASSNYPLFSSLALSASWRSFRAVWRLAAQRHLR